MKYRKIFREDDDFGYDEYESLETKLNQIYPITGRKLYYLFDFGDEWLFEIKKRRKVQLAKKGIKYPRIIESLFTNKLSQTGFPVRTCDNLFGAFRSELNLRFCKKKTIR